MTSVLNSTDRLLLSNCGWSGYSKEGHKSPHSHSLRSFRHLLQALRWLPLVHGTAYSPPEAVTAICFRSQSSIPSWCSLCSPAAISLSTRGSVPSSSRALQWTFMNASHVDWRMSAYAMLPIEINHLMYVTYCFLNDSRVVWVSNSVQYMSVVDWMVILNKGDLFISAYVNRWHGDIVCWRNSEAAATCQRHR